MGRAAPGVVALGPWDRLVVGEGEADADAAVSFDGSIHVAGFDGFVASGDAVVDGGVLTASVRRVSLALVERRA